MSLRRFVPARMAAASLVLAAGAVLASGCSPSNPRAEGRGAAPDPVVVETVRATQQPVVRTLRVTGSLQADEQAEVSAEVSGRVTATPVERGSRVATGAVLVQLSTDQARAQLDEAEANAARIAAGLALDDSGRFDLERVPDVANAQAELAFAQAEYDRIKTLMDDRVVSRSEYDQRQTRVEAARQRVESERNKARQEFRSWEAARARVALARKSLGDTTIRAPFAGLVAERLVSAGDFVSTGTRVVTVVRIDPLRVVLTVPEQLMAQVQTGQPVTFAVDAYPGRSFQGTVRYISPALRAEQRALTVEAIVSNPDAALKPGLFVSANLAQPAREGLLLDKRAIRQVGKTARVFAVNGDRLEERIVTLGEDTGTHVEVLAGLDAATPVALPGQTTLAEGLRVRTGA